MASKTPPVTGESVSYTYDSLNRLIAAATSGTTGVQWGDSYSYDVTFVRASGKSHSSGKPVADGLDRQLTERAASSETLRDGRQPPPHWTSGLVGCPPRNSEESAFSRSIGHFPQFPTWQ